MSADGIRVVAQARARAGCEAAMKQALVALAEPTRRDDGCLGWELYEDAADPARFVTVEQWRDEAALAGHMQTAHVQQAFAALGPLVEGPPEILSLRRIA